jgi:serine protease Do
MRKRHIFSAMLALGLTLSCFAVTANAGDTFRIFVNDKLVGGEAKLIDGTIYVPLKTVGDSLDTTVKTDSKRKLVSIESREGSVPAIVNKVSPSVVGIIGKLKQGSPNYSQNSDNLVFGTGVIYKSEGYIITNAHVVKDMESIVVVLSNSKAYPARLKAIDENFDLAMVKIDKGGLTTAVFGNIENVEVGDSVIAIGTPLSFSLRNSATKGIVSGINRSAEGEYRFIQSDAAINGGNSGGPLVNMKGEVIGINTVKFTGFGVEGLSFSIPVDTVKYVIGHFEKYGKVRKPYLGAAFSESVTARYGLPSPDEGLSVAEIDKDSPAEAAGIQIDDVLKEINGVRISTKVEYNEEIKKYLPGDAVELKLERNESVLKVKVTFGETK